MNSVARTWRYKKVVDMKDTELEEGRDTMTPPFWHTFEELAAEFEKHADTIRADADRMKGHAWHLVLWYDDRRRNPKAIGGREIEKCWRLLEDWKATRLKEKPVNEMIPAPDEQAKTKIAPMAAEALAFAKEVDIFCDAAYVIVAKWLTEQKALRKEINETFDPSISAQLHALNVQRAAKNRYTKALDEAETIAKGKMGAWAEMQVRAKAERERKLRDEARRLAEVEKQAEVQRLLRANRVDAAAAVAAVPAMPLAVIDDTPAVPKVDGISLRKDEVEWAIDDPSALPREYLKPDEQKIGAVVRALGLEARIPGVSVKKKIGIAAGAR